MTTTLQSIDGGRGETRAEAVARRMRGLLAESQISQAAVGRVIGIAPSGMSRRMTGKHPWDLGELSRLEEAFGLDLDYVLTGRRNAESPHPDGPGGGVVRHQGLEPRTR
ncbi:MAG: helix-turn-helix domain-containing protein [Dietzia sp.]